jgi:hypothetical protein
MFNVHNNGAYGSSSVKTPCITTTYHESYLEPEVQFAERVLALVLGEMHVYTDMPLAAY